MKKIFLLVLLPLLGFTYHSNQVSECYAALDLEGEKNEVHITKEKLLEYKDGIPVAKDLCTGESFDPIYLDYFRFIHAPKEGIATLLSLDGKLSERAIEQINGSAVGDRFLFEGIKLTRNGVTHNLKPLVVYISE